MRDAKLFTLDNTSVEKLAHLSPLMRSQSLAGEGQKVNACPFGCLEEDLDQFNYCHHVVGFTKDGKTYETFLPPGPDGKRRVDGSQVRKIERGDKLVTISQPHARVYRDVPRPASVRGKVIDDSLELSEEELEAATAPQATKTGGFEA